MATLSRRVLANIELQRMAHERAVVKVSNSILIQAKKNSRRVLIVPIINPYEGARSSRVYLSPKKRGLVDSKPIMHPPYRLHEAVCANLMALAGLNLADRRAQKSQEVTIRFTESDVQKIIVSAWQTRAGRIVKIVFV